MTRPIVQNALAAALAWYAAGLLPGHEQPFFAPVAAVLVVGAAAGRHLRRALEVSFGVALGIAVADLLVLAIGAGVVQIAIVVALAMTAAVLLGQGPFFVTQAGVSALLVVTLERPEGLAFDRFFDGLVGGAVALLVSQVLLPAEPISIVVRATQGLLDELARVLEETAGALERDDVDAAERVLRRARALEQRTPGLYEALAVGEETVRLAPPRRRARRRINPYVDATVQVDAAARGARVLARLARRIVGGGRGVPPVLSAALRDLAEAVRALARQLEDPRAATETRRLAVAAAVQATGLAREPIDLATSAFVAQVQATAVDVLQATGMSAEDARDALDSAIATEVGGTADVVPRGLRPAEKTAARGT